MGFGSSRGFPMIKPKPIAKVTIFGGGGKAEETEAVITATVVLAAGSYP